ncbi:hypothetical protein [Staphylococcus chromogenes]|uniref:hypothetical protein n=1 Tax=Staphylococcus chromogenes TaxID=46126 RepID=UPI0013004E44|nr:hypothetical protein [Staphylococcus chromogenes]
MNIKKKKYTKDDGLVDKANFGDTETGELDIEKFLNRFKKGDDNMIKKSYRETKGSRIY